jgi:ATP-dependent exoDNAse (exonuclease V) beta subunit
MTTILSSKNPHPRDAQIQFFEADHKYSILCDPDSKYTSVTTWNHTHFEKFDADKIIKNMMKGRNWNPTNKYWGLSAEQIKTLWSSNVEAAAGTALHYQIECFMNNPKFTTSDYTHQDLYANYIITNPDYKTTTPLEWQYFIQFIQETPHLKPYRTEWTVYNEDIKIAGSIDMIYENPDGTLSIYDWKRSKNITRINNFNKFALTSCICHLPDSNFWHYSLQLNTYKSILEKKYEKTITELVLVRLHPDAEEQTYELISLPILNREIDDLYSLLQS